MPPRHCEPKTDHWYARVLDGELELVSDQHPRPGLLSGIRRSEDAIEIHPDHGPCRQAQVAAAWFDDRGNLAQYVTHADAASDLPWRWCHWAGLYASTGS